MVVFGVDAHKRTHTIVIIDERGRRIADRTINATTADHLALVTWAQTHGEERLWAVEDCRHLSRRLERDLLAAGERIVRVPTKMMAAARKSSHATTASPIPSTPWRSPEPPCKNPTCPSLTSTDRPERSACWSITERISSLSAPEIINRLRWHLHELDPTWDPPVRSFDRNKTIVQLTANLAERAGTVARLARRLLVYCTNLTAEIKALDDEIAELIVAIAPTLLETCGVGTLSAAKIVGETADVRRFKSKDAFARYSGTAPLPVWSSDHPRHRLSRVGNRQLNCAIHRMALTQAHWHPDARTYLERRKAAGDTPKEALRALKRRLSDVVYRALIADARPASSIKQSEKFPEAA